MVQKLLLLGPWRVPPAGISCLVAVTEVPKTDNRGPPWVEEKHKELKEIRRKLRDGELAKGQDPPQLTEAREINSTKQRFRREWFV